MIDWFTVFAQIINFLILVFLLKKFLYGPIINSMDRREERIASQLREAGSKKEEAEKEINEYRKKNEELEKSRSEMMLSAKEEAEQRRREMLEEVRKEIDGIREKWNESVMQEKDVFLRNLRTRITEKLCSVARTAFADLADSELEEQMTDVFAKRIKTLGPEERERLRNALGGQNPKLSVVSTFEMKEERKQLIRESIREIVQAPAEVEFTGSDDIICGIEMRAEGYVISWSLNEYLKSLEQELGRALESTGRVQE